MYLLTSILLAFGAVKADSFYDDVVPGLVRWQTSSRVALSSPDEPAMTGTISTCNEWYDVVANDTCDAVAESFGITLSQFLAHFLNHNYHHNFKLYHDIAKCDDTVLHPLREYDNRIKHVDQLSVATIPNSTWAALILLSPGNRWYQAFSGDDYDTIVAQFDTWMDINDFIAWSPSVGTNCTSIYYGYWYCVGIQPQSSMIDNGTATSQWFPT
ncbi:hypothetical protein PENOC_102090 [Penicillium occitanis (nom. inval.)]|nr:hypothetical protein PENOC_102090 [Penicillium occitanis (nom. inval.)]